MSRSSLSRRAAHPSLVRSTSALAALWLAASFVGCAGARGGGGGGGGVDVSQFPSADEVAAIAARPAPAPAVRSVSAVNSWTFQGPFEETFADVAIDAPTAFEAPFVAAAGKERFTRAARCISREMAAYLVQQDIAANKIMWPDGRFTSYLSARCGSFGSFSTLLSSYSRLGSRDDAAVMAEFHKQGDLIAPRGDVGIAFARRGEVAVAVSVTVTPEVRLEPLTMKPTGDAVILRGVLVDGANAETVMGAVNQGDTAVAPCVLSPALEVPRFELRCPVRSEDDVAGVALHVHRSGRFLADALGTGVVLPGAPTGLTWAAPLWGEATPIPANDAELYAALVARINGVRAAARLGPVDGASEQSATATRVAPHYFATDAAPGQNDQIALGMLAGWDLKTPVQDADFSSFQVAAGGTLDGVLGAALDSPTMRQVLLAPKAGIIAIGIHRDAGSLNLLTTTWEPFQHVDSAATQSRVFEALKAERIRRGLAGLGEVGMEPVYADGSRRLAAGEGAGVVLDDLLEKTVQTMNRNFQGWMVETADPEHIAWPSALLTRQPTYIAVSAGMRQRKGSPWATTVVLIVAFVDTKATVALATPR